MEEDAEYQQQLRLFSECSTEKGIELIKIGEVISTLDSRSRFLDIGAGGGYITIPVSQLFDETTIIEPNEKQAAFLIRRCPACRVFNTFWSDANLTGKNFDLILCSHVLYYIPAGTWMDTIRKMYYHLEPGGRIVIVLQSPLGEVARFFSHFTEYDVPAIDLAEKLIEQYGETSVELQYFQNEIYTESLEDMADIGLFLLLDRKFRDVKPEIMDYFEKNARFGTGYHILQDEILLIVKRPL